jgi:hypothetical protein
MNKYNNISLTKFLQSKYNYFPRWKVVVEVSIDGQATPTFETSSLFPIAQGGQMRRLCVVWEHFGLHCFCAYGYCVTLYFNSVTFFSIFRHLGAAERYMSMNKNALEKKILHSWPLRKLQSSLPSAGMGNALPATQRE